MTTVTPVAGDFGITQISGDAGKLIRLGQWLNGSGFENYEHAFVYTGDGEIVEAEPGGARLASAGEYPEGTVLWSTGKYALTPAERAAITAAAIKFIKTPYSALDYFALAAHRLNIPAAGLRKYISSTKHVICSQLVDACYQSAGVKLFKDNRWDGYVTPGDLYGLLK